MGGGVGKSLSLVEKGWSVVELSGLRVVSLEEDNCAEGGWREGDSMLKKTIIKAHSLGDSHSEWLCADT